MTRKPTTLTEAMVHATRRQKSEKARPSTLQVCPWHPIGSHLLALSGSKYTECRSFCMWCSLWLELEYTTHQA